MKKYVLLIAMIMVLLSSCAESPAEPTETTSKLYGDHILPYTFVDLDAYNQFFSEQEEMPEGIPADFVKWEEVEYLGEFGKFSFTRYFESYYYIGENGIIYIDHVPENNPYYNPIEKYPMKTITNDMTTMCKVPGGGENQFVIQRNGVFYCYIPSGLLNKIVWYENGIEFRLSGELHKYPETETETLIGKLLSVSDVEFNAAVAEIKRQLNTK